jgi:hypothetical protein
MKLFKKGLLLAVVSGLGGFVGCLASVPFVTETEQRLCASQIVKHTEIINSIGLSAKTSSEVSDLLMRIRHYTDNHGDIKHWFCPECSKNEKRIPSLEENWNLKSFTRYLNHKMQKDGDQASEEVPETPEQVMKDLEEINRGVGAIDMGHQHQIIFLRLLLKELQENTKDTESFQLDDLRWLDGDIDTKIAVK